MNLQVYSAGQNVRILPGTEITGGHRIAFGDNVSVGRDSQLMIAAEREAAGAMIVLGSGTSINRRNLIAAVNEIVFGPYVLTAPNCYFADSSHEFKNVGIPITMQGLIASTGRLEIGANCWIGVNAAIIGNLSVGVGSVVGANAVLSKSIPPYCVAVGQPARVVRAYDTRTLQWERVENEDHLNDIVSKRDRIALREPGPVAVPIYAGETITVA